MSRVERAVQLKCNGANCAQSIACAFAEDLNIDEKVIYKISEGFGGGLGCAEGHCGALSGAVNVAGLNNSDGDFENPGKTKASTMKISRETTKDFEDKVGAIKCYDIKHGNEGKELCSCMDCVRYATEIAEKALELK